ncbi:hypothetical protein [Streptomyces sp. HUAS TT20]|uniref:hypothetical protein n=1 Tax=Streptomyces sp. HUAS TT20 TaxID=3447509 RepID=UPI0021DB2C96|nr:hypothetical protein [Streptomyces sp. HUAS 15-9]UXY28568.1 hypothetical protein N8I87_19720 [Streptomyces sp. HUAS 15-9]
MAETTRPAPAANSPTGYGWCAWHQGHARGVRLINVTDQGSGAATAGKRFACRSCREAYDLVPLADRP